MHVITSSFPAVTPMTRALRALACMLLLSSSSAAGAAEVIYDYDTAGRLDAVIYPDTSTKVYTLDPAGNRVVMQTRPGAGRLAFSLAATSVSEASASVGITVTRTDAFAGAISVSYQSSNGTAVGGSDFSVQSGNLTWTDGETTSRTITVPLGSDAIYEGDESFTLHLSAPTGGAILGDIAQIAVTINDDDTPRFSVANVSINEGDNSATLTVTKSNESLFTHAVSYTTLDSSATAGADYQLTSGSFSFSGSEMSKSVVVPLINDIVFEAQEAFRFRLSSPTNGALLGTPEATVTIVENEAAPKLQLLLTVGGGYESDSHLLVPIVRFEQTSLSHSLSYSVIGGTASAGSDYTNGSGTITLAPNEQTKNINIPLINDSVYEGTETLLVQISSPTNGATLGAETVITLQIEEDDPPPPLGTLQFTAHNHNIAENVGTAQVPVTRANGSAGAASVVCTTENWTAVAGTHYSATTQTLQWAHGDSATKYCQVPLIDNSLYEDNRYFRVHLSNASGAPLGSLISSAVTIVENEPVPPGEVRFSSYADVSVAETAGSVSLGISRIGAQGPIGPASAQCRASNLEAVAGQDYSATTQVVTWGAGDTSTKYCTVPIINDNVYETTESFYVYLENPIGVVQHLLSPVRVFISSDDPPPPAAPGAPTWAGNLAACATRTPPYCGIDGDLTLAWNPVPNAVYYELEWSMFGLWNYIGLYSGTNTSYTQAFQSRGFSDAYRVRACNAGGCGAYSQILHMDQTIPPS